MTTKIRAMKNKLLLLSNMKKSLNFTTVAELISFYRPPLHTEKYLPVWTRHLHTVVKLKAVMTFSTIVIFLRYINFAGNSQKKYLEYYFMKYEISILKACMRNIMDSRSNANPVLTDKHFKRHTKINIDKLVLSNTI